jgi:hypothetical protein
MDTAAVISLVTVIVMAMFTSVTAPLIIAHRTERMHKEDREADWAHQDEAAERARQAACDLAATQKETNVKLDVIHVLVNGTMTAAMQSEYDAVTRELSMMKEVMDLKGASGRAPAAEAQAAITATQGKLAELAAALADRASAQTAANERADGGGTAV